MSFETRSNGNANNVRILASCSTCFSSVRLNWIEFSISYFSAAHFLASAQHIEGLLKWEKQAQSPRINEILRCSHFTSPKNVSRVPLNAMMKTSLLFLAKNSSWAVCESQNHLIDFSKNEKWRKSQCVKISRAAEALTRTLEGENYKLIAAALRHHNWLWTLCVRRVISRSEPMNGSNTYHPTRFDFTLNSIGSFTPHYMADVTFRSARYTFEHRQIVSDVCKWLQHSSLGLTELISRYISIATCLPPYTTSNDDPNNCMFTIQMILSLRKL